VDITLSLLALLVLAGIVLAGRERRPNREKLAKLAAAVHSVRAAAMQEQRYQQIPRIEGGTAAGSGYFDATTRELTACGCHELGDVVQQRADGSMTGGARWFADTTGTIVGWFSVIATGTGPVRQVMMIFSEAGNGGDYYVTSRGSPEVASASPPTIHRVRCEWSDGMSRQLEIHRAQIPPARADGLTRSATLNDATGVLTRLHSAKAAWRARQPADTLLDLDLRAILGKRYDELAPALKAYISENPPAA
jgi:hypothetical protein